MYYVVGISLGLAIIAWFLQGQQSEIRRYGKRLPRPPGTLPFAGNGIWFLQARHKLLDWFSQCERQTGFSTYEISVPSLPPGIVINDPANVEHVLRNNDVFIKGDFFRARSWDLFVWRWLNLGWSGNGIINADGELWRIQRKAGLRFFSNTNLRTFFADVLPPLLLSTEKQLQDAANGSRIVDLQDVILELTTRFMGNVAYDMDIPSSLPFSKAFDFASGVIGDRFQNPFYKIKEFIWGAPFRRAVSEVKKFGDNIVTKAVQARENTCVERIESESTNPLHNNLINSLLDHIRDHRVVADAAMNYLSAGRDTTAQSLVWAFYMIMRHQNVQEKLLAELGANVSEVTGDINLSFDNLQSGMLPYTMAIFNETLRLRPPVPVEIKECTVATTFPDGTWLPPGSIVMWVPWAMNRSKLIWGGDADVFKPERWLVSTQDGEKPSLINKTAFEFPVFNGGPRACLGKKMAEILAVHILAKVVYKFEFSEVLDERHGGCGRGNQRSIQNSLTLPMEGGLPCRVRGRMIE